MDGWRDRWMNRRSDWWNFSPVFYKSLTPIGSISLPTLSSGTTGYSRAKVPLTSWCLWLNIASLSERVDAHRNFTRLVRYFSFFIAPFRSMVALKELRQGKYDIQREDQIEMKILRDLNNDHVVRKSLKWRSSGEDVIIPTINSISYCRPLPVSFHWCLHRRTAPLPRGGILPKRKFAGYIGERTNHPGLDVQVLFDEWYYKGSSIPSQHGHKGARQFEKHKLFGWQQVHSDNWCFLYPTVFLGY